MRPFFKKHGLARKGVKVALLDRKREVSTPRHGDDFLFGEQLAPSWPWKAYRTKWQRRARSGFPTRLYGQFTARGRPPSSDFLVSGSAPVATCPHGNRRAKRVLPHFW